MSNRVNKKYKDRLFRFVFKEKKELLALYNALNGTHYTDPDRLEITTLEDVVYMNMKNDVSFLFGATLNLFEHQSSDNPNMPLRGLFYFARLFRKYEKKQKLNIYSNSLQQLPFPQYIVFYNGEDYEPDQKILRLSDAFCAPAPGEGNTSVRRRPGVEVTAVMLNINLGRNRELMRQCRRLEEYAVFVARVRESMKICGDLEDAVRRAIADCIREGILADILVEHSEEVVEMFLTDYDFEEHMKLERKEKFAEGRAEGKAEGKAEDICDMLKDIGELSDKLQKRIMSEHSIDILNSWHRIARRAESIDEFLEKAGLRKQSANCG